ncbi:hypothetical protein ACLVWQ_17645 (plasmid) [Streptomyces sp. CWNU-52B]|uniref:hypothetical protein n=1 Tax=unclassified Streptomyces TaxID=2593676 RepID=UPI0039C2F68B
MMRLAFGAVLGLLVAYPALLAIVCGIIAAVITEPVMLTAAAGYALYPAFARLVKGWTA